jgi:uncharacterized membrane protein
MKCINTILTIVSMFVTIIILDYLWLGIITKKFIISQFGSLVKVKNGSIDIKLFVGLVTWLVIALGVYLFAVYPSSTLQQTLFLGAAFGFISYAIYDLTNLTFIAGYPLKFVFVDIAWGTFLCTVLSYVGYLVKGLL